MAAGVCPTAPDAACTACQAASGGRCEGRYGWSWTESPAANDVTTSLPGLRAVRGIEMLSELDVTTVARWRQSNWAALVRSGRASVRAASPARRRALCQLWKGSNQYHSWPILLGCPGAARARRPPTVRPHPSFARVALPRAREGACTREYGRSPSWCLRMRDRA
eukprot:3824501-Prymnesium_polylepis.1